MRRRKRTKGDILIDFTSLMDVIFILLMLVLSKQQAFAKQSEELLDQQFLEASAKTEMAQNEYYLYRDQVESSENIQEYMCLLSVYCNYDKKEITSREIRVLGVKDDKYGPVELKGNDVAEQMDELEEYLKKNIEDNPEKVAVLSLNKDDDNILYRDEARILEIFDDLKTSYPNVIIKD